MDRSSFPCGGDVYEGGRVLGQALWKVAFGRDYNSGGTLLSIEDIPDTADFIEAVYYAARQASEATREEFAWEFTWYARNELNLIDNADVVDWCEMFERHELEGEFSGTCTL